MMNNQVAAANAAVRHVRLEETNRVEAVMESVGTKDVLFVQPRPTPGGGFTFSYQDTNNDVDLFYKRRNAVLEVLGASHTVEISASWHTFIEGIGYVRDKDVDQLRDQHFIVLLVPEDENGQLVGECPWRRHEDFRRDPANPSEDGVVTSRLELTKLSDRIIAAIEARDAEAVAELFHADAGLVSNPIPGLDLPRAANGRAELAEYYRGLFAPFDRIEIQCVNRICGEWYVYSDQRWRLHRAGDVVDHLRVAEYFTVNSASQPVARVAYAVTA
jgi:hypothetical protein